MFIPDSCKCACTSLWLTPKWLVCGASSGLRGCRRRRSSKIGGQIQTLNTTFGSHKCRSLIPHLLPKLNVTARYWIVLSKENRGGGGEGSWEIECAIKQIEIIKPQQKEKYELWRYLNCAKQWNRSFHNFYECNQLCIFLSFDKINLQVKRIIPISSFSLYRYRFLQVVAFTSSLIAIERCFLEKNLLKLHVSQVK